MVPTLAATLDVTPARLIARCLDCRAELAGRGECPSCGRIFREVDGILEAIQPLAGRNQVAADFYDGPGWQRFRPWERAFIAVQGGTRRARWQFLKHLPRGAGASILEVGIGDGANVPFLPHDASIMGIDLAPRQLRACLKHHPSMADRLVLAEAEALPFADASFDACFSVGGFNYFRDHATALEEMRRVTRTGGTLLVADEVSSLHRWGIGHLLGRPAIDAWWLRKLGLDPAFVDMVLGLELDVDAVVARSWPAAARHSIWGGLGYCFVGTKTEGEPGVAVAPELSRRSDP